MNELLHYAMMGRHPAQYRNFATYCVKRSKLPFGKGALEQIRNVAKGATYDTMHEWPALIAQLGQDVDTPFNEFFSRGRLLKRNLIWDGKEIERGAWFLDNVDRNWKANVEPCGPAEFLRVICEEPLWRSITIFRRMTQNNRLQTLEFAVWNGFLPDFDPAVSAETARARLDERWKDFIRTASIHQ